MIDITHKDKLCIHLGCGKQASYNFKNEEIAIYCVKHSKDEMIDIRSKKCLDCNKKPSFNFPNLIGALYCNEHSKEGMINIYNQLCIYPECNISASYNYVGEKKRLYCSAHHLSGMINIASKKCEFEGCSIICKFNFPNEKIAKFCAKHKEKEMIHLTESKCIEENCNKNPTFNYLNSGCAKYCMIHMKQNMVNVVDPKCKDCDKIASFNYVTEKIGEYCYDHSKKDMINIYSLRCKKENCNTSIRYNNKYEGYCISCFKELNPDIKVIYNRSIKEHTIRDFIKNNFTEYNWIYDKQIKNSLNKYRPDILLDLNTHIIIIEVDEYQHSLYDSDQEERRILEIHDYLENRKMILIRFNPDCYRDKNNNLIKSPWIYYKTKLKISSNKILKEEWNNRLNILKNTINNYIQTIPDRDIEYIKLFYNEE